MLIALNKPFGVLTQFSGEGRTLSEFDLPKGIYPAGRLDKDSEGLLLLTDDGKLQSKISHPKFKAAKTYLAQVEGSPNEITLSDLRNGVTLKDGLTRPAKARIIPEPDWLWPRDPPIRVRKSVPDTWIELTLTEGRNRQVRRMTAHIGHPTLRLVRQKIGHWDLGSLEPGQWRMVQTG